MNERMMLKEYVMIGAPATLARTPLLQKAALLELRIDARVNSENVEPFELGLFIKRSKTRQVDGFMITMPHKRSIIGFLDRQTVK